MTASTRIVPFNTNGNSKWYAKSPVKLCAGPEIEYEKLVEDVGTALGPWNLRYRNEKTENDVPEEYPI